MEKQLRTIMKFWFPAMCVIGGLALLITANGDNPQNGLVMMGSVAILLVGIISLLYLLDVVNKPLRIALSVVFALGAVYMVKANYDSIGDEIAYQENSALMKSKTIQSLKDLRSAEEAFYKVNNRYSQDLDELVAFVKNGKLPQMKKIGAIPDSIGSEDKARSLGLIVKMPQGMTDEQAKKAGLIVRDTVYIPVMEAQFTNAIALAARKFPFEVDKLPYAPSSGKKWSIQTTTKNLGGVDKQVLMITDPEPFSGEALTIGSLDDAHLNGNWKED